MFYRGLFQIDCEAARRCGQERKMEVNPRGGCDLRDPVLIDEALELRFCVCLVGKITFSG